MTAIHLIAWRLLPVGPIILYEHEGVQAIVAHDAIWDEARTRNPDLPVRYLIHMMGNPAHSEEYGRLVQIAWEAASGVTMPAQRFDIDLLTAKMDLASKRRETGQTSLFG